jgi:hypothetical protein
MGREYGMYQIEQNYEILDGKQANKYKNGNRCESLGWIRVVENGEWWQAIVNMVMNICVPYIEGSEFLAYVLFKMCMEEK